MGRKRITPEKVKSVKASFKVLKEDLHLDVSDMIESSVTGLFESVNKKATHVTALMSGLVTDLDEFLNEIADQMDQLDNNLARKIKYTQETADDKASKNRVVKKQLELDRQLYRGLP